MRNIVIRDEVKVEGIKNKWTCYEHVGRTNINQMLLTKPRGKRSEENPEPDGYTILWKILMIQDKHEQKYTRAEDGRTELAGNIFVIVDIRDWKRIKEEKEKKMKERRRNGEEDKKKTRRKEEERKKRRGKKGEEKKQRRKGEEKKNKRRIKEEEKKKERRKE